MNNRHKLIVINGVLLFALVISSGFVFSYKNLNASLAKKLELALAESDKLKQKLADLFSETHAARDPFEPVLPVWPEDSDADIAKLHARIAELEAALMRQTPYIAESLDQGQNRTNSLPVDRRGIMAARMEELKNENPERYAEIMARREDAIRNIQDAFLQKAAFLLNRDISGMREDEKQAYLEMARLFEETLELSETLRANPDVGERRELMRELFDKTITLEPMLLEERNKEFYKLGRDLGYSRRESAQLVEYLTAVIDLTSTRNIHPGFGPRGRDDNTSGQPRTGK